MAADESEGEASYELALPFVTCVSNGGPHDDDSYCAGFEMGQLRARLDAGLHFGLGLPEVVVLRANVPMVDLMAMEIGAKMHEGWPEDHTLDAETVATWARVWFEWTS